MSEFVRAVNNIVSAVLMLEPDANIAIANAANSEIGKQWSDRIVSVLRSDCFIIHPRIRSPKDQVFFITEGS